MLHLVLGIEYFLFFLKLFLLCHVPLWVLHGHASVSSQRATQVQWWSGVTVGEVLWLRGVDTTTPLRLQVLLRRQG